MSQWAKVLNKYIEPMEGQEATSSITGRTPAEVAAGGKIQCFVHDFTIKAEGVTVDALHEKLSEWFTNQNND